MNIHFLPPWLTAIVDPDGHIIEPRIPEGWEPVTEWEPYAIASMMRMKGSPVSGQPPVPTPGVFTAYRRLLRRIDNTSPDA